MTAEAQKTEGPHAPDLGAGIDPDVNIEIPAPYLVGTIFKPGMATPVQILAVVKKNSEAHISLFVPSAEVNVATCSIRFRRPEDGMEPGLWFLAAIEQAGQKLFDDFEADAKKPRLLKPDGKIAVPAHKQLVGV